MRKAWLFAGLLTVGCFEGEQYDPSVEYEKTLREIKEKEEAALNADPLAEAKSQYAALCAACHGPDGKAASPAALAMNPKPRNLTDPAWQDDKDDEWITKVLVQGGTGVGLAATMPAWAGVMSDAQIENMVKFIRSIKGS